MSAAGQTLQLLSAARSYRQRRVAVRLAIGMSILPALALVTALISLSLGPLDIPTSRGAQIALSTVGFDFTDFTRTEQLIVDELGFVPFDRSGGELLFNLLAERYERRSSPPTTPSASGCRSSAMRSSPRRCSTASGITLTSSQRAVPPIGPGTRPGRARIRWINREVVRRSTIRRD